MTKEASFDPADTFSLAVIGRKVEILFRNKKHIGQIVAIMDQTIYVCCGELPLHYFPMEGTRMRFYEKV